MTAPQLALAYATDLLVGDPEWLPHPVRWFGALTYMGERLLRPLRSRP
jgi:adenosylcobinamide-phosphate synthase